MFPLEKLVDENLSTLLEKLTNWKFLYAASRILDRLPNLMLPKISLQETLLIMPFVKCLSKERVNDTSVKRNSPICNENTRS